MLEKKWIELMEKGLFDGDYAPVMQGLRKLGRPIKKAWDTQLLQNTGKIPKSYKFSSDPQFKAFLVKKLENILESTPQSSQIEPTLQDLQIKLSRLALFITVWKDQVDDDVNPLEALEESESQTSEPAINKKWLRQQIKFKSTLDKDDRYAINIGLQLMFFKLYQQSDEFIKNNNQEWLEKFKESKNKHALLELIFIRIKELNNLSDKPINLKVKPEEINKIGETMANFQTPNLKKKFLKYFGISLAFIAAIACGLTTGGAIYLLGPGILAFAIFMGIFTIAVALQFKGGFTGLAIALLCGLAMGAIVYSLGLLLAPGLALLFSAIGFGVLTGLFGFMANFGFLSKNFPDFLIQFIQKGSINEYIDKNGQRKQFSAVYKFLLSPLFAFASLTVGAGTAALTYITILKLLTTSLPFLATIFPPLPVIIAAVLASAIGIGLLVAVFTASLNALKKVAALELGFVELCKYAYENSKQWFNNLRNLSKPEIVGLVILLLLLPVGLLGLAYYRYIAGVDLSQFIGATGAIVMGAVAYLAQMAFTCLSINKFKNAVIKPSTSSNDYPALISNAVGNALLVCNNTPSSISGAIGCFVNSLCGNMSEADMLKESKIQRTASLALEFNSRLAQAEKPSPSTSALKVLQPQNIPKNLINGPKELTKSSNKNHFIRSQSDDPAKCTDEPPCSSGNVANRVVGAGLYRLPKIKISSFSDFTNQEPSTPTVVAASI